MNWRNVWNRLRGKPSAHEEELDEELAFHIEMSAKALREQGLSPEEALHRARRGAGNLTLAREQAREAWAFVWLRDFGQDVRYGARALRANPGYTLTTVAALTLGIGVTGIVFSIFNTLVYAPMNLRDAASLVHVLAERREPGRFSGLPWPEVRHLAKNSKSVQALVGFDMTGARISRGDFVWTGRGIVATENFFDVLGTGFALGRGFSASTGDLKNPAPEMVLHYDTWRSRFGGDPKIIGEWLDVNSFRIQVTGVAAPGFDGPFPVAPQFWLPAPWRDKLHPGLLTIDTMDSCCTEIMARLRPGVTREQATAELATVSAAFRETLKRKADRFLLTDPVVLSNPRFFKQAAPVFLAAGVAALLILLLACANAANMQLARAMSRRREIAVRISLGAGRGRLLRQLVTESLLLAALASTASLALSIWLPDFVLRFVMPSEDRWGFSIQLDWRVVAATAGLTVLAALFSGLAPALSVLRETVRSSNRLRFVLLAIQVALCATLLSGSALLLRAVQAAKAVPAGFAFHDVARLRPNLNSSGANNLQSASVIGQLRERLGAIGGVSEVAHTNVVPLGDSFTGTRFPHPETKVERPVGFAHVSANFLRTLRIPILAGRDFEPADEGRKDVFIIDQALAREFWPGRNAVGQVLGGRTVIGVAAEIHVQGLHSGEPQTWVPSKGEAASELLIRHSGTPLGDLTRAALELDRRVFPAAEPYSLTVEKAREQAVTAAAVASAMSGLALSLACFGLYGVAAYMVGQRRKEIGIRLALGARPAEIVTLVLGQNARAVAAGGVIGVCGAAGLGQLLTGMLYGVKPADPPALCAALGVLGLTALAATWPPARRASRIDPSIALRHE